MKKEKIWTSTFLLTLAISFLSYLIFYLLTVIMGTVVMSEYHVSASIAGIISGIFVIGAFIGRLCAGYYVVRFGIKKLLYSATIFTVLMILLYFISKNLVLLAVIRFLHGLGFGVAAALTSSLAGLIVPKSRRGEGIGYFTLSITIASAIGPFLSIFMYYTFNYSSLLILSTIFSLVAFLAVVFIKVPHLESSKQNEKRPLRLSNFFEKTALPIAIIGFLVGFAYSDILSFLASYSALIGLVSAGSLFYIIYAFFTIASRPFTGPLFDLKGDNFVLYPTFIFFAVGLVLIGFTNSAFILLLAAAFVGLGYGSFLPFGQAIAIRHVSQERVGIATSTMYGFFDLGVGVGPFVLGLILPHTGYRNLYFYDAIFILLIGLLYFFVHGRKFRK